MPYIENIEIWGLKGWNKTIKVIPMAISQDTKPEDYLTSDSQLKVAMETDSLTTSLRFTPYIKNNNTNYDTTTLNHFVYLIKCDETIDTSPADFPSDDIVAVECLFQIKLNNAISTFKQDGIKLNVEQVACIGECGLFQVRVLINKGIDIKTLRENKTLLKSNMHLTNNETFLIGNQDGSNKVDLIIGRQLTTQDYEENSVSTAKWLDVMSFEGSKLIRKTDGLMPTSINKQMFDIVIEETFALNGIDYKDIENSIVRLQTEMNAQYMTIKPTSTPQQFCIEYSLLDPFEKTIKLTKELLKENN